MPRNGNKSLNIRFSTYQGLLQLVQRKQESQEEKVLIIDVIEALIANELNKYEANDNSTNR